jgi:hypothetical protein|uniref:Uncharacterized protein n=1 Tax=viral metagenome TaxID=1070528 RepID=A0A6C0E0L5_9ZZZZ
MSQYGEMLDGGYEPEKDYIYDLFTNYFNNPTMRKFKNQGKSSLYACKIYCLLNKESRYLIVVTNIDGNNIGTVEELRTIKWVALQTRSLSEKLNVDVHGYTAVAEGPLTAIINRIDVSKSASTYNCVNLPIIITLLHTEKKDANTYQQKGTVIAAIETYETIITFSNKI